jgi:hypothetical protein
MRFQTTGLPYPMHHRFVDAQRHGQRGGNRLVWLTFWVERRSLSALSIQWLDSEPIQLLRLGLLLPSSFQPSLQ